MIHRAEEINSAPGGLTHWVSCSDTCIRVDVSYYTERKNGVILTLNSWVTGGTKIRPGIPSNLENISVNLTQIFSNYSESLFEF